MIKKQVKSQNIRREFSAGGAVFKRQVSSVKRSEYMWLLGKHSGYHKWVLPKGLIEKGERGFETAVREVFEETGVRARLISEKPIHQVKYVYWAEFKRQETHSASLGQASKNMPIIDYQQSDELSAQRRVKKYQESGGKKTKVYKVVSFYLMEYASGDPKNHDWEMEDAGWYAFDKAMKILAFNGEKEALGEAKRLVYELV